MSTPTAIVNVALRRLGLARLNSMETDTEKEAVVARDIYDEARQDLLGLHTWNFAIRRASLTASSTSPTFGWDYTFPLPDDFIRVISVHPTDSDTATVPYRLENQDGDDRVLLTNSNQIYLRYVFDLRDVSVMPAYFRDVFAFRLARDIGAAIGKPLNKLELTDSAFHRKLARAKAIDGVEDWPEQMAEGSWITDRGPDQAWPWS